MEIYEKILGRALTLTEEISRRSAGPDTLEQYKDQIVAKLEMLFDDLAKLQTLLPRGEFADDLRACARKLRRHGGEIIILTRKNPAPIEEIRGWAALWLDFEDAVADLTQFLWKLQREPGPDLRNG